ncbi:MAG TPA: hypothetical protein VGI30_08660 [Caulobacteraceae bacterium]|jgi:hypothetical protein
MRIRRNGPVARAVLILMAVLAIVGIVARVARRAEPVHHYSQADRLRGSQIG